MRTNFKKSLVLGTALVAAVGFAAQAHADTATLTGNVEWGNAGTAASTLDDGTDAAAGDQVNLDTFTLTVTDDGANSDGTAGANFVLGDVIGSTGDLAIVDAAAGDGDLVVTVNSFSTSSTGDFTVNAVDAEVGSVAVTVTGGLTTGGVLSVINTEGAAQADIATLNVGGALNVTGVTTLTAAVGAGAASNITVTGDSAFTGAVGVNGGTGAGSDATLTLNGSTNTATNGIALTDGAAGSAILKFSGSSAQTLTGAVTGDGSVVVDNASGVYFYSAVTAGDITIEKTGGNSSAVFYGAVTAPITLGTDGNVGDVNTVTFDGTTAGFTVTGAIAGTAGETNNIVVQGGNTIVQATASTADLTAVTVQGAGTTLDSAANLTAATITVDANTTLLNSAGTLNGGAGGIVNNGTLQITGAGAVATGAGGLTGTGLLNVDNGVTITGAITQGTADIAAVTLTQGAASGYSVGTTNFSGAGTVDFFNGNQTITGNFTNTTDGEGTISLQDGAGTTAIVGNLGDGTSHSLAAFNFENAGGNANVVTTTGNWYVDATQLDAADELKFIGTSAQTVSGTIVGYGAGEGILTVGDGTNASDVTFDGVIGTGAGADIASVTVAASSTARFNANLTTDGTYTNTGTTYVGVGATVEANDFTDTGSYVLNAQDADLTLTAADFGSLNSTGGGDTLTATNLTINVTGNMGTGTVQLLTGINTGAATLVDNSLQYSFVVADNGANTDVTVARTSNAALATGNKVGSAAVLDTLLATTNTELDAINDKLAAASTQDAFNEILEATLPNVDGGTVVSVFETSVQSLDVNNQRLAAVRSGDTGVAAGNMGQGVTAWIQGFGQLADQDRRDGVDGYEADTYGFAVGVDSENVADNALVGVALSYANTDVDSDNANTTKSDIDSYQVTLYGDYDLDDATYIAGNVGYARNSIDQTRHNVGGVAGLNANADYDSSQWMAYAELGRDYAVGTGVLTPNVNAQYQHISIDDYTETGAGGASLSVNNDDLNIFELGIGAQMKWDHQLGNGSKLVPALHAGYTYDLIGDDVQATANFTGGGASFSTKGMDPARSSLNAGASVSLFTQSNVELTGSYDFEYKSDYNAHAGYIRAGVKF